MNTITSLDAVVTLLKNQQPSLLRSLETLRHVTISDPIAGCNSCIMESKTVCCT